MSTPALGTYPQIGETFVQGHDAQIARDLLAATEALGLDVCEVRTTQQGFIVPSEVWDYADTQRSTDHGLNV